MRKSADLKRFLAEQPAEAKDEYGREGSLARILLEQIEQDAPEMAAHIRAQHEAEMAALPAL